MKDSMRRATRIWLISIALLSLSAGIAAYSDYRTFIKKERSTDTSTDTVVIFQVLSFVALPLSMLSSAVWCSILGWKKRWREFVEVCLALLLAFVGFRILMWYSPVYS